MGIEGVDPAKLSSFLWDKYRIIVAAVARQEFPGPQFDYSGVRVTPNIYTPLEEIDTFVTAMEDFLQNGLP